MPIIKHTEMPLSLCYMQIHIKITYYSRITEGYYFSFVEYYQQKSRFCG